MALTNAQRTAIFGYAKQLGIKLDRENKEDELYDLIERETSKRSISKLSAQEADRVLTCLKGMLPVANTNFDRWRAYAFGLTSRDCRASLKQLEFIRALIIELARLDPADASKDRRLRGWLEKFAHTSDVRFLTPKTARNVIDGLKAYLEKLGWEYHPRG